MKAATRILLFLLLIPCLCVKVYADQDSAPRLTIPSGHSDTIRALDFSPDGRLALSGSDDKSIKVWQVPSGKEIRTLTGHKDGVTAVRFLPDGKRALSGSSDGILILWDLSTGRPIRQMRGNHINSLAIDKTGRYALTGGYKHTVQFWDVSQGKLLKTMDHGCYVNAVYLTGDATLAVSGGNSFGAKLWDVRTGRLLKEFSDEKGDFFGAVAISDDRKRIIASFTRSAIARDGSFFLTPNGDYERSKRIWDIDSGKLLYTSYQERTEGTDTLLLQIWPAISGKAPSAMGKPYEHRVMAVSLSADNRWALTAADDGVITLWEVIRPR